MLARPQLCAWRQQGQGCCLGAVHAPPVNQGTLQTRECRHQSIQHRTAKAGCTQLCELRQRPCQILCTLGGAASVSLQSADAIVCCRRSSCAVQGNAESDPHRGQGGITQLTAQIQVLELSAVLQAICHVISPVHTNAVACATSSSSSSSQRQVQAVHYCTALCLTLQLQSD